MKRNAKLSVFGAVVALVLALPPTHSGAATVQLITPYPAVASQAGKTITLNLEVVTSVRARVGLAVTQVPAGWQATLRGGGFVIHGVFGSPKTDENAPPQVQLEIRVPADAAQGDYRVAVRGTTPGGGDTLVVDIRVSETATGAVTLSPEFPSLRGAATDTFRFNISLTNNSPEKTTFNLSAEGPEGWKVSARPTSQAQASTVAVDGGATATVEVEADPPDQVTAGSFPIKVRASGGGKSAEADVTVEITGSFQMSLTTSNERLNAKATAGRGTRVTMKIENGGTAPLNEVKLSGSPPSGWKVTFSPETINRIDPKKSGQSVATITPPGEAVAGDYVVTVTASGEGQTENVELRVTVETSALWGIVGLLVIAAALGGLFWVFRRFGRR